MLFRSLDKEHAWSQKLCKELSYWKEEVDAKDRVMDRLLLEISKLKEVSPE